MVSRCFRGVTEFKVKHSTLQPFSSLRNGIQMKKCLLRLLIPIEQRGLLVISRYCLLNPFELNEIEIF